MRRVLVLAVSLSAALRIFGAPQPAVFRLDGSVSFGETGFGLRPAVIGKGWAHAALVRPPQEIARKGDALCAHYKAETDSGKIADVEKKAKLVGYTRLMRRLIRRHGLENDEGRKTIECYENHILELLDEVDTLVF